MHRGHYISNRVTAAALMCALTLVSVAFAKELGSRVATSSSPERIGGFASEVTPGLHASSTLSALHSASGVPGLAAAIAVDGVLLWEEYLGLSDIEAGIPITPETRFRVGSVSKVVTAVALARLWQEGNIDLDADVLRYVPQFPHKGSKITPRQLAGHLGGIRSYEQKDFSPSSHIDRRNFATTSEALTIFGADPLVAPPGERYHYSVFGYTLLSAAMEGAAEEDFLSILKRQVFDPLGLRHTGADSVDFPGRATAYERTSSGGASLSPEVDLSYKWAGGGLHSIARDLVSLGSALLDPNFLTPAALKLLTTSQKTTSGVSTDVAIGWRVGTDSRDRLFIHHAGSISGGRAVILVFPAQRVSVAITSNQVLAPLMVESTAQVLAEPFLLERERKHFDRIRQVARFDFSWTSQGIEHTGLLRYGSDWTDDRIDLHPALKTWAGRLGSPMSDRGGRVLPMLLTGETALVPVVTTAGAFGIDIRIGSDDSLSGVVSGQYVRGIGRFRAERVESTSQ